MCIITSFKDIEGRDGSKISMHLSDTVEIIQNHENGHKVLTERIPKNLSDIGYTLEDDDVEPTITAI